MPPKPTILSPAFLEAAKYTRPKDSLPKVYVYVEDDIDTVFWRCFLDNEEYGCSFVIRVYKVMDKEMRGKDAMMKDYNEGRLILSNSMLLCLDSDLDLIVDGYHNYTQQFRQSPFVISTIWYSIENLKCYHSNVVDLLYQVTLTDVLGLDVKEKLSAVSNLINELFLVVLVSYSLHDDHYSLDSFCNILNNINYDEKGNVVGDFEKLINDEVNSHFAYLNNHKNVVEKIKKHLENEGYLPEDCLCIIRGHDLVDKIIKPFVKAVGGHVRDLRLKEIGGSGISSEYKKQLHQQYSNQTGVTSICCLGQRTEDLIRDCNKYQGLPVYDKIKSSIKQALVYGQVASILSSVVASKR